MAFMYYQKTIDTVFNTTYDSIPHRRCKDKDSYSHLKVQYTLFPMAEKPFGNGLVFPLRRKWKYYMIEKEKTDQK